MSEHTIAIPLSETGYVYFIQDIVGNVKVGWTNDLRGRLRVLQSGNPGPLDYLHLYLGDRSLERALHVAGSEWRIRGEWFYACEEFWDSVEPLVCDLADITGGIARVPA